MTAALALVAALASAPAAQAQEDVRADWQHPDAVVRALGLRLGQTVCDIGAGPGYFALRLAKEVAPGMVYAVDVEPRVLEVLRGRMTEAKVRNVTPVLGMADDPLLGPGLCDLVLIVDTYHHFEDGQAYL